MKKLFSDAGWDDYKSWLPDDRRMLKRINDLIKDIDRNGNDGIGSPEPLKGDLSGYWSRRIDNEHRLVYRINDDENAIEIISCRTHYARAKK